MKSNPMKIPSAAKVIHDDLQRKLSKGKFSYENVSQENWDRMFPKGGAGGQEDKKADQSQS